jgi:hypothetical protein
VLKIIVVRKKKKHNSGVFCFYAFFTKIHSDGSRFSISGSGGRFYVSSCVRAMKQTVEKNAVSISFLCLLSVLARFEFGCRGA